MNRCDTLCNRYRRHEWARAKREWSDRCHSFFDRYGFDWVCILTPWRLWIGCAVVHRSRAWDCQRTHKWRVLQIGATRAWEITRKRLWRTELHWIWELLRLSKIKWISKSRGRWECSRTGENQRRWESRWFTEFWWLRESQRFTEFWWLRESEWSIENWRFTQKHYVIILGEVIILYLL